MGGPHTSRAARQLSCTGFVLATIPRLCDAWENRAVTAIRATRPAQPGPFILPALALAFAAASVAVALDTEVQTTYAAMPGRIALDLAAGVGLIGAGVLTWVRRPTGPLAVALGVAWLAHDWVGWIEGPAFARSVGMVAAPFLLPLLAHLVVGSAARVVALTYGVTALVSAGLALARDPFLDPNCWSNCTDNVFLVHASPGAVRLIEGFWLPFSIVASLLVATFAVWRLWSASRPGRAATWTILAPAGLAALGGAAHAMLLLVDPAEDPRRDAFDAVFVARALAFVALAVGVAWTVARARWTRAAIARLAADLGETPEPGSLRAVLARTLGDQRLDVAYPLPGSQPYVDAEGRPLALDGRATTAIVRNGEPVAVVIHDSALTGAKELEREVGAAARLAVDNERLRAGVLAQLEDLRASRARIVEAGDAARRRIERDLHDGAQQRLLTVSFELRLARAAAGGDAALAALLEATGDEVQSALEELRDLAHGIYPAVLTEAGLGPALETLADDAPVPVELAGWPDERFPEAVERAAYIIVSDTIDGTAAYAEVSVTREGDTLAIAIGPDASPPSVYLADRVGALGGRIGVEADRLRAEIPCA
jgi:signal transduction histidine kinase